MKVFSTKYKGVMCKFAYNNLEKSKKFAILAYGLPGNTAETLDDVLSTRRTSYPDLREQLDLLYKDMAADKGDKTGEWFKAVKKVKDDNPK